MGGNNIYNNTNNGVLVARGGRENSNPAKTKTHSGTVEKETHFINVVGKKWKKDELLQVTENINKWWKNYGIKYKLTCKAMKAIKEV